jgi:hypothetical protein
MLAEPTRWQWSSMITWIMSLGMTLLVIADWQGLASACYGASPAADDLPTLCEKLSDSASIGLIPVPDTKGHWPEKGKVTMAPTPCLVLDRIAMRDESLPARTADGRLHNRAPPQIA